MYNVMISEVYIHYYSDEFWREADENLQTWICKRDEFVRIIIMA